MTSPTPRRKMPWARTWFGAGLAGIAWGAVLEWRR